MLIYVETRYHEKPLCNHPVLSRSAIFMLRSISARPILKRKRSMFYILCKKFDKKNVLLRKLIYLLRTLE